jgi:D-citramalate synthase
VLNLLCKGSFKHVTEQLRKTPEQHLEDIRKVISLASGMGILVNIYLEDWSNGMRNSRDYVHTIITGLRKEKIGRMMLPDTLGILNPDETYAFCREMIETYPEMAFDFHAHNDYDLAVANVYQALKAGIRCIHTTVNGLGERAGNVPLSSVMGTATDHLQLVVSVNESMLNRVSKVVESFSGVRIPGNKPLIGDFVFTQCSGIHADGDSKNNLYFNELLPERFGRIRKYALGKTSGKANIKKNLEDLGWNYYIIRGTKDICYHDGSRYEAMALQEVPCDTAIEWVHHMDSFTHWFWFVLIGVCVLVGIGIAKYVVEKKG